MKREMETLTGDVVALANVDVEEIAMSPTTGVVVVDETGRARRRWSARVELTVHLRVGPGTDDDDEVSVLLLQPHEAERLRDLLTELVDEAKTGTVDDDDADGDTDDAS